MLYQDHASFLHCHPIQMQEYKHLFQSPYSTKCNTQQSLMSNLLLLTPGTEHQQQKGLNIIHDKNA
jgi:hypothetical protein